MHQCKFDIIQGLERPKPVQHSLVIYLKQHLYPFELGGTIKIVSQRMTKSVNELINDKGICRAVYGFAWVCQ